MAMKESNNKNLINFKKLVSNEISPALLNVCLEKRLKYYHPSVGEGEFVNQYIGKHGRGLIIRLPNGREWFAPAHEFTKVPTSN
jgi:hypothetical protein